MVFSAAEVMACLVGLVAAMLGALGIRRRALQRRWPTFEASVRTSPEPMGRGWTLGLGCYDRDVLRWYRLLSLRMQPGLVVDRRTLQITGSRCPIGHEARALLSGHVVLEVSDGDRLVELGVGDAARTHLTAWIETAPRRGEQALDRDMDQDTDRDLDRDMDRGLDSDLDPGRAADVVGSPGTGRIPPDRVRTDRAAFQATTTASVTAGWPPAPTARREPPRTH